MTAVKTKCLEVLEVIGQRTQLVASHLDGKITFLYLMHGPNTYANVGNEIDQAGLQRPTMAETVSLVYAAFNSDDKYSQEIKNKMRSNCLRAFTGNLYVPNQGVFIEDNPRIEEGIIVMNQGNLITRLRQEDPSVRFVPFGFKIKEMSSLELAKNPYIIALARQEGAEKLAEVADKHRKKPYLWSSTSVKEPLTRVSALGSFWDLGLHRLNVFGDYHGGDKGGFALGVRRTGEASHAEK